MANKRTRITGVVTPIGEAVYPYLNRPDDKFGDPKYKTDLRLTGDEAEKFFNTIKEHAAELLENMKENGEKSYKKFKELKALPIKEEIDDEGDVIPGSYIFRAKTNAFFTDKQGNTIPNDIQSRIVDSNKNKLPPNMSVRGGSKIRLSVTLMPYTLQGGGVSAQIDAVQVSELAQGSSSGVSDFDSVEDGFTVDENTEEEVVDQAEEDDTDFA